MKPTNSLFLSIIILCTVFPGPPGFLAGKEKSQASGSEGAARRTAIVAFCQKNRGRKVGNGECWTLANEAFKHTGAQRPARQLRVWGRRLDLRRESPLPGDILECDRTRFSDGSYVMTQHTAVITGVHTTSLVRIAEQNFAGKKSVRERDLDLGGIRSGSIAVYRPQ